MKFLLLLLLTAMALPLTATTRAADAQGRLRHVVSFKFKPDATQEQIDAVVVAFRDLKKSIPQIQVFEWGTNVSPEKHDKGFTHCFILTFQSEKDRDDYLVHSEHKKFGQNLGPVLADVFVIDYWVKD